MLAVHVVTREDIQRKARIGLKKQKFTGLQRLWIIWVITDGSQGPIVEYLLHFAQ